MLRFQNLVSMFQYSTEPRSGVSRGKMRYCQNHSNSGTSLQQRKPRFKSLLFLGQSKALKLVFSQCRQKSQKHTKVRPEGTSEGNLVQPPSWGRSACCQARESMSVLPEMSFWSRQTFPTEVSPFPGTIKPVLETTETFPETIQFCHKGVKKINVSLLHLSTPRTPVSARHSYPQPLPPPKNPPKHSRCFKNAHLVFYLFSPGFATFKLFSTTLILLFPPKKQLKSHTII